MVEISKALKVAKKLNIEVKFTDNDIPDNSDLNKKVDPKKYISTGSWPGHGKTIYINKKYATNYTVLHEIGHVLNGLMCCREHCEFAAHGAAIALAKANNIKLGPYDKFQCDPYAGRSSRKACAAIDLHKQGFSGYEQLSVMQKTKSKVTRVLDNATFMIENKGRPIVLKGIKPVEKGDSKYKSNKNKLERLIKNKIVFYKWIQTDVYGRKVCQVYVCKVGDKYKFKDVNKEMKNA